MTGRLIGVVGPSGVGKDTVIKALVARVPNLRRVRRVITRAAETDGEDHEPVSEARFAEMVQAGAFALHWHAHGLSYGVPTDVHALLRDGDAIVNLSRSVLAEAQARFSGFAVLALTADPGVLAARLQTRGREDAETIAARLARADHALPKGLGCVVEVANEGPLDQTVDAACAALGLGHGHGLGPPQSA